MYNLAMILFLSQYDDNDLKEYILKFNKKTGIKTVYKTISDFINNTTVNISCKENKFFSFLDNINFADIKICYINFGFATYKDLFDFDSELDNSYALQEWTAAITCLLNTNKNTKFINPHVSKKNCDNQIENSLIFQKHGITTPECFLTNNAETFLNFYQIYNENLIIKNIAARYNKSKIFTMDDMKKIKKLYLSPYVFQKSFGGIPISVILISNDILAANELTKELTELPKGLKENLINVAHDINAKFVKYRAILENGIYNFYDINQNCSFGEARFLFGEKFDDMLTNYLLEEYKK